MPATQSSRPLKEFEQESTLWDWISNTGTGIWRFSYGDLPDGCFNFVIEQFARFNVPFPESVAEVAIAGASAAFYVCDSVYPYGLFSGTSDVDVTDDWGKHAYELLPWDDGRHAATEADVENLESFAFMPGQCEKMFNYMMSHPGLQAIPSQVGDHIDEIIENQLNGEEVFDAITAETDHALRALCFGPVEETLFVCAAGHSNIKDNVARGEQSIWCPHYDCPESAQRRDSVMVEKVDQQKFLNYFKLAAWAGFVWLAGPLGREYRRENIMVFDECLEHGECILIDGTIIGPQYYRKTSRPPKACHVCHVQAWCIELTVAGDTSVFICEGCLNGDFPRSSIVTCGTKLCRDTDCHHHPLFNTGSGATFTAAARYGQLGAMAQRGSSPRLFGPQGQQLKLGF